MRLGLKAKYSLLLVVMVIGAMFLVMSGVLNVFERGSDRLTHSMGLFLESKLLSQLEEEGRLLVSTSAENLTNPVYFLDIETINELLSTLKAVEDVQYAYLLDAQGKVLTDGTDENPLLGLGLTDEFSQGAVRAKEILVQGGERSIDIACPIQIKEKNLGWVRVGFSTERIRREKGLVAEETKRIISQNRDKILRFSLVFTAVLSLAGMLTAFFIAGRLVRPIQQLSEAAARVGKGDFTGRVKISPVLSQDELGELAASFNQMTENLEKTTVSKEYVDKIFHSMIDTLIVVDRYAKIRKVNRATCELLGFSEEELLDQPVGRLLVEEASLASEPEAQETGLVFKGPTFQRLIEEGTIHNQETRYRAKDGRVVPVLFSGSIMYHETQGMVVVAIGKDITDLKRAEEQLARQAEELARSNQELEQFAYVASHDLREPLRKVASFTQLLAERYKSQLDEKADKFIEYIIDGATRMQTLIDDLLTYSRVGRGEPALEPTDCGVVLQRALADLEAARRETGAEITWDTLPTVQANPLQLGQLLQNLIANAVKFHGPERPKIHLSAKPKDDAWLFSVRDNGIGIDPQHAERIFVMFQRLHTRAEYSGSGIGLAVCKKIVERHGGRIWVESQLGQGAAFYFTWPMRPAG